MAAPKAPLLDGAGKKSKDVTLEEAVFGAEVKPHLVHETVRAELNAQRAGHARGEEPRARRRRPREAVAPEGHGSRPRGHDARAALDGRRRRVPADGRELRGEGQPQGAPLRVPRRALAARRQRHLRRPRRLRVLGAVDAKAADLLVGVGQGASRSSSSRRRRGERRSSRSATSSKVVVVTVPAELEVAALVWARSLLVTEAALDARAGEGVMSLHPNEVLLAPVVSEKSYALIDEQQVLVPGPSGRAQDAGPPGRRGALRGQGLRVNISKVQPKPKRRGVHPRHAGPAGRRRSSSCSAGDTIEIFEGAQV